MPCLYLTIALLFCLIPPFQSPGAQDTIYLPFPDLPREIIEPESPEREILRSSGNKETIPKNRLPSKTNPNRNSDPPKKSIPPEKNNRSQKPNPSAESLPFPEKTKTNPLEKDGESDILNPADLVEFRKAMAGIRKKESDDRNYAEKEYTKLAEKYSHPYFRGKILISLAWNYFHRRENFKTLQTVIRILEDKSLLEMDEYPTAMYLAYRIHGRPWAGRNENFQNKYKEIFRKNVESGRENFQKSLYKTEFH